MALLSLVVALSACLRTAAPLPPAAASLYCTCLPGPRITTREDAERRLLLADTAAHAVFEGRVLAVRLEPDSTPILGPTDSAGGGGRPRFMRLYWRVATVRVARRWSPSVADTVEVRTMSETTMCGAELDAGQRYLFVADRDVAEPVTQSRSGATHPSRPASVAWSITKCGYTRRWDREARRIVRLLGPAR